MRLIDVNELLTELEKVCNSLQRKYNTQRADLIVSGIYVAKRHIQEMPTVDAEPVIRCKDCKYYEHGENPSETWSVCIAHINRYFETCADNFCAWAERKEE